MISVSSGMIYISGNSVFCLVRAHLNGFDLEEQCMRMYHGNQAVCIHLVGMLAAQLMSVTANTVMQERERKGRKLTRNQSVISVKHVVRGHLSKTIAVQVFLFVTATCLTLYMYGMRVEGKIDIYGAFFFVIVFICWSLIFISGWISRWAKKKIKKFAVKKKRDNGAVDMPGGDFDFGTNEDDNEEEETVANYSSEEDEVLSEFSLDPGLI